MAGAPHVNLGDKLYVQLCWAVLNGNVMAYIVIWRMRGFMVLGRENVLGHVMEKN